MLAANCQRITRRKYRVEKRRLFRVIDPRYGRDNIYRRAAQKTVSLGLVAVATAANEQVPNLEVEAITENNFRAFWRKAPRDKDGLPDHLVLQQERPAEIIGISASISNAAPRALELIKFYCSLPGEIRPKAIIVGGWHAGDLPQDFLEAGADVVVHGKAEPIIGRLLVALLNQESLEDISGISYWSNGQIKRNPIFDKRYEGQEGFLIIPPEEMDCIPFSNFGLVRYAKITVAPVMRTDGCSGRCKFCRVKAEPRSISPDRFAQGINILRSQGFKNFFLVDDRSEEDLPGYTAWLTDIANWRKERKIRRLNFTVQSRLMTARNPQLLGLMRAAGIKTVAIGVESVIPEELQSMVKPMTRDFEEIVGLVKTWKKFGFFTHVMLIFGFPVAGFTMDVKERMKWFWKFLKKAEPDTIQILALTPIPGTETWHELAAQNRILINLGWENWDGLHVVFKPDPPMTAKEVQKAIIQLQRRFYAFHYVLHLKWISLFLYLIEIGVITVALPVIWPLALIWKDLSVKEAFGVWYRIWRNTKRRAGAHLIVQLVESKLDKFTALLNGSEA